MTDYRFVEFSFNKVAEFYHQDILSLNFEKVKCNYYNKETGALESSRDVLCVDYRYVDTTGALTRKRLFPRYAVTDDELNTLAGKEISDVLFRHGYKVDKATNKEVPAEDKWTAYCDIDGQWHWFEGRKSDWDAAHQEDEAEEAEEAKQ